MAKIFDFYPGQGSLKDCSSTAIPTIGGAGHAINYSAKGRVLKTSTTTFLLYQAMPLITTGQVSLQCNLLVFSDISAAAQKGFISKSPLLWYFYQNKLYFSSAGDVFFVNLATWLGQFIHICMTYDESTGNGVFYINNVSAATVIGSTKTIADGTDLYFAAGVSKFVGDCIINDTIVTAAERTEHYNAFLKMKNIERPIMFGDRWTAGASGNNLIACDGTNWNADGVSKTAGRIGDFVIGSGTFACTEDATGKLITCSVNGTLQIRGIDLSLWTGNGYVQQIDGSLSAANANMTVNDAPALAFSNNTLTITMTAGQTIRNLVIARGA